MKKRCIYIITAILFILASLTLSGCGSNLNQTQLPVAALTEKAAQRANNDGPLTRYNEPVVLTTVATVSPIGDKKVPPGTTPENQSFLKIAEDKLNIKIKYLWSAPDDQFKQKLKLSIASGDIPDIMKVASEDFEEYVEAGILADLQEAYDRYALPEMKADYEKFDNQPLKAATRNGKLLSLPYSIDPNQAIKLIWVREDWLKNLNLEPPKTMNDVKRIVRAFAENDPDRNGKDDTFGFALNKEVFSWAFDANGLAYGYHAYPGAWIRNSEGKLVYGSIQPEMKNVLAALQDMYKNGWIDREYAIKDINKVAEDAIAGKIGLTYGEWWMPNWPFYLNIDKQIGASWKCYPLVSADDRPALNKINRVSTATYNIVSKNCKNPDAAIKLMNLYWDIMYSKDPESRYGYLIKPENGFVYNYAPIFNYPAMTQENNYNIVNKALQMKEPSFLVTKEQMDLYKATLNYRKNPKSTSDWGLYYSRIAEDGGWGLTRKVSERKQVIYNEYYGPATATQLEKGSTLLTLETEVYNRIIMGEPLNKFDKFVTDWKNLGGGDITKEVNDWYAANDK